jgi:DNA-binding CsgD family transcriptional regulator
MAADMVPILPVIQAGALGVVTRGICDDELVTAVGTVGGGSYYICAELAPRLQTELCRTSRPRSRVLALRELETQRWLTAGFTHGQIARRTGLFGAAVSTYVKRIRAKLDVGDEADLVRCGIELGLLDLPELAAATVVPALRLTQGAVPVRPLPARPAAMAWAGSRTPRVASSATVCVTSFRMTG